jgi:hypothetical protein
VRVRVRVRAVVRVRARLACVLEEATTELGIVRVGRFGQTRVHHALGERAALQHSLQAVPVLWQV